MVLEKDYASTGEKIQIEDWSEDYPNIHNYGDTLVCYAKTNRGYSYRAECQLESYEAAKAAFDLIKSGSACLDDFNFTSHKSGETIPFRQYQFGY